MIAPMEPKSSPPPAGTFSRRTALIQKSTNHEPRVSSDDLPSRLSGLFSLWRPPCARDVLLPHALHVELVCERVRQQDVARAGGPPEAEESG